VVTFAGLWLSVLILVANALVPTIQGVGPHAGAVTLALGMVMWAFVRRIGSLGDSKLNQDCAASPLEIVHISAVANPKGAIKEGNSAMIVSMNPDPT
jgi:hypothetical protein